MSSDLPKDVFEEIEQILNSVQIALYQKNM